jgi:hypothetical protein
MVFVGVQPGLFRFGGLFRQPYSAVPHSLPMAGAAFFFVFLVLRSVNDQLLDHL